MRILDPYAAYIIPEDGYDIYMFALNSTWVAIKYGKDDYVEIRATYATQKILRKKEIKKIDFSHPGFNGIGKYIISNLFDENHQIGRMIDIIGKE